MEKARDLKWEDIKMGEVASFSHIITEDNMNYFARVSGNYNPLHTDEAYARKTKFGRRIVYGMFFGALCSRFFGMYLPGKRSLCLSQELYFKNPAFIGDVVEVSGEVKNKNESNHILDIWMEIRSGGKVLIDGIAKVQLLEQNAL